ncbi:hypothetical protein VNI00_000598 [Paramarasmius palmivorus]|uniref:Protein kinase domain-containing protein n=1 Tax=Paramarasmius palmivorus TaxID=297713 RepID=A0AAW0E721_9AGAR
MSRTPARKLSPTIFHETPKSMPKSHQDYAPNVRLNTVRDSIMEDMGPSIPQIPFDDFLSMCLPAVDPKHVSEIYDNLKKKGVISNDGWNTMKYEELKKRKTTQQGASSGSAQDSTSRVNAETIHEDKFFNPLAGCFNEVLQQANEVLEKDEHWKRALFKFCSNPRASTHSEGTHGSYISDVYALLDETRAVKTHDGPETGDYECDVVLPGEYKKDMKDEMDNNRKVVSAANHIMAYDPTRRFIFGITIEHTNMKIWFFSRSHVFVSGKVDLQKEAKRVVAFIVALGSATLHELGFDWTMERVLVSNKIRYRFMVGGKKYEMTKLVSHAKAKFLLGRAPRVFRVKLVGEDNVLKEDEEELLLKDAYIPEDSMTEKEILDEIYNKVNSANPVEGLLREEFYRYFVQIEACERIQVPSTENRSKHVNDNSSNFLRHKAFPSNFSRYPLTLPTSEVYKRPPKTPVSGAELATVSSAGSYTLGGATKARLRGLVRKHYGYKVHCRLVMKDGGDTLEQVTDLPTLLRCLRQAVKALQYMYSAGYVHRDISTGNILFRQDENGQIVARLCDLEYAKEVSQPAADAHQDFKTGTPHFIAVEVEQGDYEFWPDPPALTAREKLKSKKVVLSSAQAKPPFRYNYLHDLESVWWILSYTLFSKVPEGKVPQGEELQKAHDVRSAIFPHPFTSLSREKFLTRRLSRQNSLVTLPEEFSSAGDIVDSFGYYLADQYTKLETRADFPAGVCFLPLHDTIQYDNLDEDMVEEVFPGRLERLPPRPLLLENGTIAVAPTGSKRKPDNTEDMEDTMGSSKRGRH